MKFNVYWQEYWPEIIGGGVFLLSSASILSLRLEVSNSAIAACASLSAQILCTALGLILTAYIVFQGMKVSENIQKLVKTDAKDRELIFEMVEKELSELRNSFLFSIRIAASGTVACIITYYACFLAKEIGPVESMIANIVNSVTFSAMLSLTVVGLTNLATAVKTLFHLDI